jgi:hypothetical protein
MFLMRCCNVSITTWVVASTQMQLSHCVVILCRSVNPWLGFWEPF